MKQVFIFFLFVIISLAPSCPQKSPEYYLEQGKIEAGKGNLKQANKYFNHAIKLNPDYIDAYYERAFVEMQLDSFKLAIADFDKVIEKKQTGELYYQRANAKSKSGDVKGACEDFNSACDLLHNRACDLIREKCR